MQIRSYPKFFSLLFIVIVFLYSCKDEAHEKQVADMQENLRKENQQLKDQLSKLEQKLDKIEESEEPAPRYVTPSTVNYVLVRILYEPRYEATIKAVVSDVIEVHNLNNDNKYRVIDQEEKRFLDDLVYSGSFIIKREFYRFTNYAAASEARSKKNGIFAREVIAHFNKKPLPENEGAE